MDTSSTSGTGIEGLERWSLRLLGDFQLSERESGKKVALPGKRERVLLAYLALSPNGRTSRRKSVTLLWGDSTDATALDNLRTCVFNLRKALGDAEHRVISSEGRDIMLDAQAFEIDVLKFRCLAAQSGRSELEAAAKLYSGEFLDGLKIESEEFESWRREEATRCRDQTVDVLARSMTQLSELGETERAIEAGTRILRLEPLHEAALRGLMRLYGGSGRRGTAVQLYRTLAETLRKELNAQPEAETRAVFAEISRGGEEPTSVLAAADANPPSRSTAIARPADAPGETSRAPTYQRVPAEGALRSLRTSRLGWILAGGLAAVMATFLLLQEFAPLAGTTTAEQQARGEAADAVSPSQSGAISIAVLPFENLSGDPSQEFFSDGMTEEITSALAKIADLRVVGRTSAFQFKGEKKDLRAIGQALIATHLLEGSVRKTGTRVRIAVQLIKTGDGKEIWSESYDRELTDVFAIQEDIATAIASALRMPLGLKTGEHLVANRSIDPESYQQFLRAKPLVRARERGVAQAIEILEPLVKRNPDYAPAWALLASGYSTMPDYVPPSDAKRRRIDEFFPKAETAARRALQLDPNLVDAYMALARMETNRGVTSGVNFT